MKFCLLASGSRGNSLWVEEGDVALLVDCGLSFKELKRRAVLMGLEVSKLVCVLVTHEHRDHISGLGPVCRSLKIPALGNKGTWEKAEVHVGKVEWQNFTTGDTLDLSPFKVRSLSISHDAENPVAFVLESSGAKLGLATDLGAPTALVRQKFKGLDALILEFNHDYRLLLDGPYPWPLKQRVRSRIGHLANDVAAQLASELYHRDLQHLVLAHLSETNNHPDLALKAAKEILGKKLEPVAASQNEPTRLFEIISH